MTIQEVVQQAAMLYGGWKSQFTAPRTAGAGVRLVWNAEAAGRLQAATNAHDEFDRDFVLVARADGYGAEGGGP